MDISAASAVLNELDALEPSLQNVLDQTTLRWIFVGGKGGVGKTTTSCTLASRLAQVRESVLIISTDPAHNVSDAFSQKFSKTPTLVNGFDNLYAMEIDPSGSMQDMISSSEGSSLHSQLQELTFQVPGIDECLGFAEVMNLVKNMDYSCVVFDTAPTGHTLRFLSLPKAMDEGLGKLMQLGSKLGPLLGQFTSLMGGGGTNPTDIFAKFEELRVTIKEVNTQFMDPEKTTFVCVCISEFLSLYETERLIQDLTTNNIDTHNIVVNQLLFPPKDSKCEHCLVRAKMQQKYLEQIYELYEDFHITLLPLLTKEIRGSESIKEFSDYIVNPYKPLE